MRCIAFVILIVLFTACQGGSGAGVGQPEYPNIVIILADDLGYGDLEIYNSESKIPTPFLNQLAGEGMRFTDAHSPSSVCSPTRYGLLTGRYAWRTELKSSVLWAWDPPLVKSDRLTLPKLLKPLDYQSACVGKWHLGWRWPSRFGEAYANDTLAIGKYNFPGRHDLWKKIDFSKPLGGGPLEAGFDYYFGDDVPNFPPYTFFENYRLLGQPEYLKPEEMFGNPGPMVQDWDLADVMPAITAKAVEFIEKRSQDESPFFLYFSLTAPHTPIAPQPEFQGKSGAGLYGDFVHQVDWSVGQVVEALRRVGAFDNTLLIFTSDNGSPQRDGTDMSGPITSVRRYDHDPSRPWRGLKADIWEGGHRVPFIATWPERIPAGSVSEQLFCLTDVMASVASVLEIPRPSGAMEDSFDFSSVWMAKGQGQAVREDIIHHSHRGVFAIRKGNWKLILGRDSGGFSNNLEIEGIPVSTDGQLYDLVRDPSEQINVYSEYPNKVRELSKLLIEYQESGNSARGYPAGGS